MISARLVSCEGDRPVGGTGIRTVASERWISRTVLLMGLLAFWAWAGVYTLAPGHIGWIMAGMDTPQHYLGWQFFRHAPWQWPAGVNPGFGSDAPGTIVLADSIPLMALLLKVFSPLLAADFQYLGLWAFSCFLLQAWFARKLLHRITDDVVVQLAGVGFFLTATIFLLRLYIHPALAAQWLLLAAFHQLLSERFRARSWILLLGLAVLIHAYLFVMVAGLWAADLVRRWLCGDRSFRQTSLHGATAASIVALLMWMAGYFVPGAPLTSNSRTYFDLVQPFWTGIKFFGEWSWFLPPMEMDQAAYDGFSYLGLGFIGLLLLAAIVVLAKSSITNAPMDAAKKIDASTWWAVSGACGLLFFYSLGNQVHFARHLLFSYTIPSWLNSVYGTFRANARMMWPAWYLLLLAVFYILLRRLRIGVVRYIVMVALLAQLCDLSKAAVDVRKRIAQSPPWHSPLASPVWASLPARITRVAYMNSIYRPPEMITFDGKYKVMADYAAKNGMSISLAYLARTDTARLARAHDARIGLLLHGRFEPATIYVVDDDGLWAKLSCLPHPDQWMGTVDGMRLLVPGTLAGFDSLPAATCNH